VQARGFGWRYQGQQRPSLEGLDFSLAPGDLLVVLGATGSGRSTLARALSGVVPHRCRGDWVGSLAVDGQEIATTSLAALAGSLGVVTADTVQWQLMTRASDQIALHLENRGVHQGELVAGVARSLKAFGIEGDERIDSMSAGRRQWLAIAAAFAAQPPLLILDGPTDHLSGGRRADLIAMLGEHSRRRDQTIVLTDRYAADLFELTDKVLVLDDGRQVYFGPPVEAGDGVKHRLERAGGWRPSQWTSSLPVPVAEPAADASRVPGSGHSLAAHPLLVASGVSVELTSASGRVARTVLSDFSLTLRAGDRIALVGDNGAGSTLLLRVLAGERRFDRGSVLIGDGTDEPALDPCRVTGPRYRRLVGLVHELPRAVPLASSVYRVVSGGPRDIRNDETAWSDLNQSMDRFAPHLPATAHPLYLSAGAARLAQLCRLLWTTPGVAMLDQPDVGLDQRGWVLLVEILDEMRALGQAQIIATHDERLVATADSVVKLGKPRAPKRKRPHAPEEAA